MGRDTAGSVVFGPAADISIQAIEQNSAVAVQVAWSAQYTLP